MPLDAVSNLRNGAPAMLIQIMNSQQGARLYALTIALNLSTLGFGGSTIHDWTAQAIEQDPKKQRFMEKLTVWAEKLQDGVNLAIGYSKPADAFKDVPDMDFLFDPMYASAGVQSQKPNQGNSLVFCSKLERMVQEGKETCPQ